MPRLLGSGPNSLHAQPPPHNPNGAKVFTWGGVLWGGVLQLAGALVLFGGAMAVIVKTIRWGIAVARKIDEFLDDWVGEPARHGRAAVPGVMERLVSLEDKVNTVAHEVQPNSGTSLKDQITRIEEHTSPAESRPAAA
jgi:hypothetical protein